MQGRVKEYLGNGIYGVEFDSSKPLLEVGQSYLVRVIGYPDAFEVGDKVRVASGASRHYDEIGVVAGVNGVDIVVKFEDSLERVMHDLQLQFMQRAIAHPLGQVCMVM